MWLMLQQDKPVDYVIGTGKTWSVKQLVETAFSVVGLDWQKHVEIDNTFMRPAEVDLLVADPSKAKRILSWEPKTSFEEMVEIMVRADIEAERNGHEA
jgi:GDPmannose 4,6-dehydratase